MQSARHSEEALVCNRYASDIRKAGLEREYYGFEEWSETTGGREAFRAARATGRRR